ncbi:glycine betaine ABC transporter substrate-binding protein [soil metagenome]
MDSPVSAAWAHLPDYLGQHVILSAIALLLGAAISLPLAVLASRRPALRWPLMTGSGLIQTIPSLALLALFYPLLLGLSGLTKSLFGVGFSALGFLPALLALTLYSMLPMVRNTVAGLSGIDAAVLEAARGVGMTSRQSLWRVELPLAASVILAGIRTSAVWVIGAATLSTPIGQTSLGNYIFTGLQTENWVFVLFGCFASAGLALVVDQLLGLIESGLARRDRKRVLAGVVALIAGLALALAPVVIRTLVPGQTGYVIGSKTFSEQYILSSLIADRLKANGLPATERSGLGSTVVLRALAQNDIDVYVEYSGTIWGTAMGHADNPGREAVTRQVTQWLRDTQGITVLGGLGFENAYALAMRRDKAGALGIHTLADLGRQSSSLTIGVDYEFLTRPEWSALKTTYNLNFKGSIQYQSTFMYRAVVDKDVDVISAFSSDGRIAADDLVVLSDPAGAIPPYDALILIAPRRRDDARLKAALQPLVGAINVDAIRQANQRVDGDMKATPAVAATWLESRIDPPR